MRETAPRCIYVFLLDAEDVGPLQHVRQLCRNLEAFDIVTVSNIPEQLEGVPGHHARIRIPPAHSAFGQVRRLALFQLRAARAVRRFARGRRSDRVVVLARQSVFFFALPLLARVLGIPLVTEVNGLLDQDLQDRGRGRLFRTLNRWTERFAYRTSRRVVTVHENLRAALLRSLGLPADLVVAVENGTRPRPLRSLAEAKRHLGALEGGPVIGYLGSLAHREGVDLLVEAFGQLRTPDARLRIVGGREADLIALQRQLKERKMESRVELTGHLPYEEAMARIEACDVLVHLRRPLQGGASDSQGSPLKMLDYHSAARPVVATRLESYRYIEEYDFGVLVNVDELSEVAAAIDAVLADPERAAARGRSGHAWVQENRLWRHTGERVRAILANALGADCAKRIEPALQRGTTLSGLDPSELHYHVLATHGLGDIVMVLPLLDALRQEFPDATVSLTLKGPAEAEVVANTGAAGWPVLLVRDHAGPLGWLRYLRAVRRLRPDVVLCTENVHPRRAGLVGLASEARYRLGRPTERGGRLFNVRPPAPASRHKTDGNIALLAPFLGRLPRARPAHFEEREPYQVVRARALLGIDGAAESPSLVAVAPGSGAREAHKRWPIASYCLLVRRLLGDDPALRILVLGGAEEGRLAGEILESLSPDRAERVRDLTGRTTVTELISVLGLTDVVVANCNGISHVAAAAGAAVIGLYGPTDPGRTGIPEGGLHEILSAGLACAPCYSADFIEGCGAPVCMTGISVDRVHSAILDRLGLRTPSAARDETGR